MALWPHTFSAPVNRCISKGKYNIFIFQKGRFGLLNQTLLFWPLKSVVEVIQSRGEVSWSYQQITKEFPHRKKNVSVGGKIMMSIKSRYIMNKKG